MSSSYPGTIDNYGTIPSNTYQDDITYPHLTIHNNINDSIKNIEQTIGTTSGTAQVVLLTQTQTLTNKTYQKPIANTEHNYGNLGTAPVLNFANGDRQAGTINSTGTATFSNAVQGQYPIFRLIQGTAGGAVLTLPTGKYSGGTTLGTSANAINLLGVYYDGTNYLYTICTFV